MTVPEQHYPSADQGSRIKPALIAAALAIAVFAAALAPGEASAEIFHPFVKEVTGAATPAGASFKPRELAVDPSASQSAGDLYAVDGSENAIDKFSAAGAYICQITGAGENSTSASECDSASPEAPGGPLTAESGEPLEGLAVDPSNGELYVADTRGSFSGGLGVIDRFGPGGSFERQLTGFSRPRALAIDPTNGDLVIQDGNTIKRYDPSTESLSTVFTPPPGTFIQSFALDPTDGDLYVLIGEVVKKLDPAGNLIESWASEGVLAGSPSEPFPTPEHIAVDPSNGDLYVAATGTPPTLNQGIEGEGVVDQFDSSGSFLGRIRPSQMPGRALHARVVASSGSSRIYLISTEPFSTEPPHIYAFGSGVVVPGVRTDPATELAPHEATLNGAVNPSGVPLTQCEFDYVTQARFEVSGFAGATQAPCEPAAGSIPVDSVSHPVKARVAGLKGGTTYRYRLRAANANDASEPNTGDAESFATLSPPTVDEAKATELTATSATLTAKINPKGKETQYWFEYDTVPYREGEPAHGTAIPLAPAAIGAGTADVKVSQAIAGLTPGLTYHWRVVAESANGAAPDVDHTFVFLEPEQETCEANASLRVGPSAHLPDCRAYEMVTPARKNGALIGDTTLVGPQPALAPDGSRLIVGSIQCFAGAESCHAQHGDGVGSLYSFTRSQDGWSAEPLSPPAADFAPATPRAYSAASGRALFSMATPPKGEDDFYRRETDGSIFDMGPNTPPALGALGPAGGNISAVPYFYTADLSHFIWTTGLAGVEWPFDLTTGIQSAYEYVGLGNAQPLLVGVGGPNAGPGSTDLLSACGTRIGDGPGALSADGRTVFFIAESCSQGSGANAGVPVPADTLYARIDGELPDAHTVAISDPNPSECGSGAAAGEVSCREVAADPAAPSFVGASEDGSLVYFASTQQLTPDASEDTLGSDTALEGGCARTTGPNGCNLYLYDFGQPDGHRLSVVSAGDSSGEGPRVRGVMATTADGSHVYFVAQGILAGNENDNGEKALSGANNLYVYQRNGEDPGGQTKFITTLPAADKQEWLAIGHPANVTPDGRFLVFLSRADLTADDTSRSGAQQVFRYDAQTETLSRVSIGTRGFNDNGNRSTPMPCSVNACSEDASIARYGFLEAGGRFDPTMSDDGNRVFFQSPIALAPGALDDAQIGSGEEGIPVYAQNVYEWEAQGTGGCAQSAGCVALISVGQDTSVNNGAPPTCAHGGVPGSVCLIATDSSGKDVFFTTTDQLVPQDTDTEFDFYDARIDGGFAEPSKPVPCPTADACHLGTTEEGPARSPSHFEGPEEGPSHPRCGKGFVKKHGKCVRTPARRRHHKHKRPHKRAGSNGGGHR